eukprot:m.242441 g.242441  ORF g.242441 m.242441 type:complete len:579 (-) comp25687_c0_seq1:32-1768(-)
MFLRIVCLLFLAQAAPVFHVKHNFGENITGRVYLFLSLNTSLEPRFSISDDQNTQQFFGVNAEGMGPGVTATFDSSVLGFPLESLAELPTPVTCAVQAVIQPYDLYNRSASPPVWLPRVVVNRVGGLFAAPGTHYSKPTIITITADTETTLVATETEPDVPFIGPANDTDYIKHVTIRSRLLSEFWGRDVALEACVLLPLDWAAHPEARFPLVLFQGHYSDDWSGPGAFSETPPSPTLTGIDLLEAEYAYYLFRNWSAPDGVFRGRRVIVVSVKHPTPFFDDSYAVNSENQGPYGDAIMYELLPHVETLFRGIGQGWARTVIGESTGGWEAMASQVLYPHVFNGAWVSCPDPLDFRAYTTTNIYEDENAYYYTSPWKRTPRPGLRDWPSNFILGYTTPNGMTTSTVWELNQHELVLGDHSRSCGQYDIWEATFAPRDKETGFPMRLWDKRTGNMNFEVTRRVRENYDLSYIMQRDWGTLGPLLTGKLHIFVGASDSWYLNNAVMLVQDFLESTTAPPYNGTIEIGAHAGRGFAHCWTGARDTPNSIARLTQLQRFVPDMVARMLATAPHGADTSSWRY